ncbi:MAG: Stk1 family PASTA domain-containing Ser/Thr kinase [Lachnospiraceae bacterium]|nr:Stk1 family PASTA domain-containing Ser/Thr kinase [Lachnospiraceae bacterium]
MLKIGQFLGDRYEILTQVGVGGMAEVYRAKDHKLNRMVAVKVLKDEFNDKNFVSKFKAEAQAAAGLSHPNIVSIYDVGDEEDIHYIVMELVEGITLKQYIEKKKKLDIKEAIGITIQIAQGIGAAHEKHIIHRDIKPQNVIISKDGKVKVTDFGIAKVASSQTIDSKAVGSVYYFSPEQARGGYCDERSDIYSLGISLYEMLTGQVPFSGESTVAVALAHLQMDMTPPRQIDPMIPVSLEKIILKSTQKKPERRYGSASELIADLRKALLMPDEDFVRIMPTENTSPTLLIGEDEITAIKQNKTVTVIDEAPDESSREKYTVVDAVPVGNNGNDKNYEDGEEKVRSVWDKVIFIFGIVICIMILCIAAYLLSTTLRNFKSQSETTVASTEAPVETTLNSKKVIMPKVVGMTFEDAAKLLKNDYSLGVTRTEMSSESVEAGYVISQQYSEGEAVDKNISVELIVSSGSGKVTLPEKKSIEGVSAKTVRRNLKALGLTVKEDTEYSKEIDADLVTRMIPEPGSKVDPGSEVTIFISLGEEVQYVYVPELKGYTQEEAEELLDSDLIIDEITEKFSDGTNYKKGQIMEQSLKVNERVEKGTKIDLTVSKGNEFTQIPEVKNLSEENAIKLLEEDEFIYVKTEEEYSEDIDEGKIISVKFADEDKKDNKVRIGAKATLIMSKGSEYTTVPSIVGKTEEEAKNAIKKAGLEVGDITKVNDSDVKKGNVISQVIEAGEKVKSNSKLSFTVSLGQKMENIPEGYMIIGVTFEQAQKTLTDLGFAVQRVDEVSETTNAGYVMKCNYQAGQSVPYGSTVILTVAKAPETEPQTEPPVEVTNPAEEETEGLQETKQAE